MRAFTLLADDGGSRVKRDRVELLTALINAPGFDPLYRSEVIEVPPLHRVYGWCCVVEGCERGRVHGQNASVGLCQAHHDEWKEAKLAGITRPEFLRSTVSYRRTEGFDPGLCRICPERPAKNPAVGLCHYHSDRWRHHQRYFPRAERDFERWVANQTPQPGFGTCQVRVCPYLARSPLGLCTYHEGVYYREGSPGRARLVTQWWRHPEPQPSARVTFEDEVAFGRWCIEADPAYRIGVINLVGISPLLRAEIQWGLNAHAQVKHHTNWSVAGVQRLVNECRRLKITSLVEFAATGCAGLSRQHLHSQVRMISLEIANGLRCIYYSPADTKDAGFIETDHFGRRFKNAFSHFDLSGVPQRWLRDLLWDQLADMLRSPQCPRTRGPADNYRRAAVELGAFLEVDAPGGGHDPTALRAEHAQRFVADQRHRERHGLPSLGLVRSGGKPTLVTDTSRRLVFNHARRLMFAALESGRADRLGLDHGFITALPHGGADRKRSRNPFTDEIARALADEANLAAFAEGYDPNDRGLRDIWETLVATGRRANEVIGLRLDCIGRYRGLPMLWHDQTKVGHYNEGIRIPEYLYDRLDERRRKTLTRFEDRQGRQPTAAERAAMALFPTHIRNRTEDRSISYGFFGTMFRQWVHGLNLGGNVPHQARHTLATRLLSAGASLAHIRRYLGQVSDRMAEHYAKVSGSELDDLLNTVWVAGPGAANPGEPLSGSAPLSREEAMALALDLSRRSTPTEGGFCTFQPVVNGDACPWKLNCEGCDKFVMSGGDLLYWRRKQEQWRSIAERAPDDATADYLHQVFEPTARAIAGLEKALAGLGLLDQALALDLRRPQDYYQRIWSTGFRASDLAAADTDTDVGIDLPSPAKMEPPS